METTFGESSELAVVIALQEERRGLIGDLIDLLDSTEDDVDAVREHDVDAHRVHFGTTTTT